MVGRYENQDENGRWYTRPVQNWCCENLWEIFFKISTSLLALLLAPVGNNKQNSSPPMFIQEDNQSSPV